MVGRTIVMSLELVGGTTLVLTIGALTAAARSFRSWFSGLGTPHLEDPAEHAQPIAQIRAHVDPYRDAAGDRRLADALGVSLEDLQHARTIAHTTVLSHLLDEGLITVAAAKATQTPGYLADPEAVALDRSRRHVGDEAIYLACLAESLGISLEKLQDAREAALERALTTAIEQGALTDEQLEDRMMRYRAHPYTDPRDLLAESLDIAPEELAERRLHRWLIRQRLDWRTLIARLAAAREDALTQAVEDGQLTPSQATILIADSHWIPLLDREALHIPPDDAPRHGFLYLRSAEEALI